MVKLNKIYTRTGDRGTTGLVDGSRIAKHAARMEAVGSVDEANSAIGLAVVALADGAHAATLTRIQNDLFDLGADIATPGDDFTPSPMTLRIVSSQAAWLEGEIDRLNGELSPLKSFILPGGSAAAAWLHLARTVCRRAERIMVELMDQPGEEVSAPSLQYVNRLSDYLFVASRHANDMGASDVLWAPGQNR